MADLHPVPPAKGHWIALVLTWLVATGVNLAKPFHIDDTAGLLIAEAISRDPLHPMGGLLNWLDTAEPIFVTNQPHLFFYITAATVKVFGNSELALHLMLSLFSLVAIFSIHGLLRRFVPQHALWATCVSILGPGFLINQNVMTDVPLLAMLSLSVLLLTRPEPNGTALGFVVFSLALLTKYTALLLFPALLWAAARRGRDLIWVAVPMLALLGWSLFNLYDYGAVHILNRPSNVGGLMPSPKLTFALICNLGLFALPIAVILMLRSTVWIAVWFGGLGGFLVAEILGLGQPFQALMLPNAMLFASAAVALISAGLRMFDLLQSLRVNGAGFRETKEFRELVFAIWLLGGMGFLATFPPFMASRHALLLMPPLLVLALGGPHPAVSQTIGGMIIGLWAAVGGFVVASDISFARFYRDTAPVMAQMAAEFAKPGARIYTRGHWGWQWYARQTGMIEYDSERSRIAPGDILVDPLGISSQAVADLDTFEPLATVSQRTTIFTRLDAHRFYASGAVALPVFAGAAPRAIQILKKGP